MRWPFSLLCLLLVSLGGCGSSLRMQHQSDVYFERCHAADFNPEIDIEQRRACWAKWLEHYTVGQPPDRIRYARRRLQALQRGEVVEPLPGIHSVSASYTAAFLTSAPGPESEGEDAATEREGEAPPDSDADEGASSDGDGATQSDVASPAKADTGPDAAAEGAAPQGDGSPAGADRGDAAERNPAEASSPPKRDEATPPPPATAGGTPCGPVCKPRWSECAGRCEGRADSCLEACRSEYRTCMNACF